MDIKDYRGIRVSEEGTYFKPIDCEEVIEEVLANLPYEEDLTLESGVNLRLEIILSYMHSLNAEMESLMGLYKKYVKELDELGLLSD